MRYDNSVSPLDARRFKVEIARARDLILLALGVGLKALGVVRGRSNFANAASNSAAYLLTK